MLLGKSLQIARGIFLGTEADRVKENVTTDAAIQHLLNLNQVMSNHRADVLAACEHKLDDYALVLDEIFVEVDLLALLCDQFNIGKVTPSCRADTNSSAGRGSGCHSGVRD